MDNQNETQSIGFSLNINASNSYELREVLSDVCELATGMFDAANKAIYEYEREQAFIRYCFTGRFE